MRLQQARPMTPEELRSTGSKPDVSEGAEAPHRKPNMELLDKIREAVLLSAAHLDLFQREPSHQKLRAIVDNISFFHLQDIEAAALRAAPPSTPDSAPDPEGLPSVDVERLALAMMNTLPDVLDWEMHADEIAAEYARLSPVDQGTEPTVD